eukprot:CAMPEP_0119549504 /NCGR_PEP_ID=MMETSP1352-20130426/3180_1 /TAXON_ID=265584 /ORGANISM="Stauroneis constricta, Strain CCMP1120" /LENGTH=44 /DNA_ID= /DNA_START= /DNA_END= /DNA_ORIENTATION=
MIVLQLVQPQWYVKMNGCNNCCKLVPVDMTEIEERRQKWAKEYL